MGTPKQSFVNRLFSKVSKFVPIGILFFAWLIFSSPFIFKGDIPFPSKYLVTTFAPWSTTYAMPVKSGSMPDVITQIYPWKNLTIESWKRGEIPLWNPYSFSGTLHAGNYQTAVFSPINFLYGIFSMPIAWSISVLLQPLLAGIFMYLFLRSEKMSEIAASFGALAFMFCGFMVVWMAYETLGFAALMLPLCLYAINQHRNQHTWWALPLLALSIATSLVSGHFQISIYVIGFVTLFSFSKSEPSHKSTKVLTIIIFILFGILIATPQLWETFRAYSESVRSGSFGKGEIIPWQYLITFFAPDFFGHPVTRNDWFGHYAEWAGFIGVIPLILALYGVIYTKHFHKSFFVTTFIISLLFALPTYFTDLLFALKIPVLSTSSASRIIMLSSFSLAVLCAMGYDILAAHWEKKEIKKIWSAAFASGIFLAVFWFVLKVLHPLDPEKLLIAVRNSLLPSAILVTGAGLVIAGLYIPRKYRLICVYGLLLLTGIDLVRFSGKWMPFEPREYLYPKMPVTDRLAKIPNLATDRVIGNFGNEFSGMYHIQGIEGYDAVYKRRYGEFLSAVTDSKLQQPARSVAIFNKNGDNAAKVVQLLGVKYYLHKVSDGRFPWAYPFWEQPNFDVIWRDATYEIFENSTAYPRAFLASSYRLLQDPQTIISTLFSDTMDRRNSIILEVKPSIDPAEGKGEVSIVSYLPQRVVLHVKTEVPKLLFLSDSFDDGWNAYINGKRTTLYRADYAFRAVVVPKGEATVIMVYEPPSIRYGMIISTIAMLLVGFYAYRAKHI